MLKIAEYNTITGEKVELEELEKYGFKLSKNLFGEEMYLKDDEYEYDFMEVFTENKNILMCISPEPKQEIAESFYDLIKDGLVIKED